MANPLANSNIARQAFREMKLTAFSSLGDDDPDVAAAAEQYGGALDACLESYDWGFARQLASLPPVATIPAGMMVDPDLPGLFLLPGDFLALRKVIPEGVAYRQDDLYLRADQVTALTIRYTRQITNEARMPATFRRFVSFELADRLAPDLVGSRTKRADITAGVETWRRKAIALESTNASATRMDGREIEGYWADEATR